MTDDRFVMADEDVTSLAMALVRGHQHEPMPEGELERKLERVLDWARRAVVGHSILELAFSDLIEIRVEENEEEPRFVPAVDEPDDESIAAALEAWGNLEPGTGRG